MRLRVWKVARNWERVASALKVVRAAGLSAYSAQLHLAGWQLRFYLLEELPPAVLWSRALSLDSSRCLQRAKSRTRHKTSVEMTEPARFRPVPAQWELVQVRAAAQV
jgi:hypothetical protein